ncbi:mannitol dehydrogenase family protein [Lactovum odontotermitis]
MMKKVVIIGAGQTGRGFIAPILDKNDFEITFLDKNEQTVQQLNTEKEYRVEYFGGTRQTEVMTGFQAFSTESKEALSALAASDLVAVSVLANNIPSLIPLFQEAAGLREKKMIIICCENGVNVKKPLVEARIDAVISEGIIFCTTLQPDKEKLDLLTQDYPEIPVDGQVEGLNASDFKIAGMPLEMKFPELIQRKIYTYNFISAIVSYFGSYLGYKVYGEAANDPVIASFTAQIVPTITEIVAKEFDVAPQEQLTFTQNAVTKFQNKAIYDTIYRNAREAARKLSSHERLVVPLKLALKYQTPTVQIELVLAAAVYYGYVYEQLVPEEFFAGLREEIGDERVISRLKVMFNSFHEKQALSVIIDTFEK